MSELSLLFDSPGWLLLALLLLPLIGWLGWRSMASLGNVRWAFSQGLRALICLLLLAALAELNWLQISDRLAVFFLLDCSASVSPGERQAAIEYINASVEQQRDPRRRDRAGVIVFGREANVELPPLDDAIHLTRVEAPVDAEYTDISSALRLAQASFPADAAKRVVLLSDGNQNRGQATLDQAALAEAGVGIDVVPLASRRVADVAVERLILPSNVRRGSPYELRVVLMHRTSADAASHPAAGRLVVTRRSAEGEELLADEAITVAPGKHVWTGRETVEAADFYTYQARFIPAEGQADAFSQNNRATGFAHIRGRGSVLWIEDWTNPGQSDFLVQRLREAEIEVTRQPTSALFTSLADLQKYDCVVLADVPRTSGEEAGGLVTFSDEQIDLLVRNTEQMGCGLVLLGGPNSLGAGGWANTALEKAMPVDFQIKNAKVAAVGALMLVLDSSGSMSGIKLELSKSAAVSAAKMLGPNDQMGVVTFDSEAHVIVPLTRMSAAHRVAGRISRIGAGGGTNMLPALQRAYRDLERTNASIKHVIVLTDGQTTGTGYPQLAAQMRKKNITTTTVAVGADAARSLLNDVAGRGGGKFYTVDNPRAIPRVFMRETRRVVRPLIYESADAFTPQLVGTHEMLAGFEGQAFPPISGYVLTTLKENPLVEVPLRSPKHGSENNALLATWTYGLGRTLALTTDTGERWASAWRAWPEYDRLFTQMIRWSMRPLSGNDKFQVASDVKEGKVRVAVTALDKDENLLNFLQFSSAVVGPDNRPRSLTLTQTAPGRYTGELDADQPGSYLVSLLPGGGRAPLRMGVDVPYSAEYVSLEANVPLLRTLSATQPRGGAAGQVIELAAGDDSSKLLPVDVFRRDLSPVTSALPIWHLLVFASACLFFGDVLNRRVAFPWAALQAWMASTLQRLLQRQPTETTPEPLARLQNRKQQIAETIRQRQAQVRFEPLPPATSATAAAASSIPAVAVPDTPAAPVPEDSGETYSERLLKAKRAAQQQFGERGS